MLRSFPVTDFLEEHFYVCVVAFELGSTFVPDGCMYGGAD